MSWHELVQQPGCQECGRLRQALHATCRRLPAGVPGQALPAETLHAADEDFESQAHQAALRALREHLVGCEVHQAVMKEAAARGTGVDYPSERDKAFPWKRGRKGQFGDGNRVGFVGSD